MVENEFHKIHSIAFCIHLNSKPVIQSVSDVNMIYMFYASSKA